MHRLAFRTTATLACLIVITPFMATPASAKNATFESIASVLSKAGVDHDSIEMARYTVNQTQHAGIVYSHAVAQDYPFFGLVGAVKAAKGKNYPGIGTFTQAKCETPITAIDVVFGKADGYIDDTKGKSATNSMMGSASAFAADYAKSSSADAKQQLVDQLNSAVPYFGEIKTICSFAFETDFIMEKNLQKAIGGTTGDIVKVYRAFDDGDYVSAVSTLLSLGVSGQAVCSLTDGLVDQSLVGRTPLLGDIAKKACRGFAGKVIDGAKGIIHGGVGLAEKGVSYIWEGGKSGFCAVYSLVGSGCSSAPKPNAETMSLNTATQYCSTRGGIAFGGFWLKSASDFGFRCNDKSECQKLPNTQLQCVTGEEKKANDAQRRQLVLDDLSPNGNGKLNQWTKSFVARWQPLCPAFDSLCRNAIANAGGAVRNKARAQFDAKPDEIVSYFQASAIAKAEAEKAGFAAVEEARFRLLPSIWAGNMDLRGQNQCLDQQCRNEIATLRDTILQTVTGQHKMKPNATYASMGSLYASADTTARGYIVASLSRAGKKPVGSNPVTGSVPPRLAPQPLQGTAPTTPQRPLSATVGGGQMAPADPATAPKVPVVAKPGQRVTVPTPAPREPAQGDEPAPTGGRPPREH